MIVVLLVFGPKRLPEMGKTIGKGLREFRKATDEVRYSFEADLDEQPPLSKGELSGNGKVTDASDEEAAERPPGSAPPPAEQS